MNRRELIKALFAGTALAALPPHVQDAGADVVSKTTYNQSQWTHVLFSRTGDDIKIYLNDEPVNIDQTTFRVDTEGNLEIYDALLRDVLIEVRGDMQENFTLTAWIKEDVPVLRARPKIKYR